ncbi:MAG: CYTH domain-containing protein [Bacteroides sp.]|nr:CYTH domain-containing protein [Bacteroides sp.]MCM1378764.1 CYTH domain-containing protein [Bacteroides sp.]MCM1445381.1 CYTH domain-containing protein [Prevotella sp.]
MAKEIERKFLVDDLEAAVAAAVKSSHIMQGYLSAEPEATVRVRVRDDKGFLTVKSKNQGAERGEWEYEIPLTDAQELLALSQTTIIDKTRYIVPYDGHNWEVDVFASPRKIVVAEVELEAADDALPLPAWIGREVTGLTEYYNSTIAAGVGNAEKFS